MHQRILVYNCINNYTLNYLQQYFLKKLTGIIPDVGMI